MGVKGFWVYLERFLDFHELMKERLLPDASGGMGTLLIDGNNAMFTLLYLKVCEDTQQTPGSPIDLRFGGSYEEYRDIIRREFLKLQEMGFQLEVYFDGKTPPLKSVEVSVRRSTRNESWATMYDVLSSKHITFNLRDLPLPVLSKHILQIVLKRDFPDIPIHHCASEADHSMGLRCKQLNDAGSKAYIYSEDSDFAVMPGCALIKTGTFHDNIFQAAWRNNEFSFEAYPIEVWRRGKVADLFGLNDTMLGELLLMFGSDFTTLMQRRELVFEGVPADVLANIGEIGFRNDPETLEQMLSLVKQSGPAFRVCAPTGTVFHALQEFSLEYSRKFWSLTLDESADNARSEALISAIHDAEWQALKERIVNGHIETIRSAEEEDDYEVTELDAGAAVIDGPDAEADDMDPDDNGLWDAVSVESDEESLARFEPEFSDEFWDHFRTRTQYQCEYFNDIPLMVLKFIEDTLDVRNPVDEVGDLLRQSFVTIPLRALKVSLLLSYEYQAADFDRKGSMITFLRSLLAEEDLDVAAYAPLGEDGGIDLVECYKAVPTYDYFATAYLYQLMVRKYISHFPFAAEYPTSGVVPELFFNGPLFHHVCKKMVDRSNVQGDDLGFAAPAGGDIEHRTTAEHNRTALLAKLATDRLIFVSGETGCGKSSRIPTFILQDCRERGVACRILVCEPKRLGAEKLFGYVSRECDAFGITGATLALRMGFGVREGPDDADITFATSGYVCQKFVSSGEMPFTHVIIDEIHERTVDNDLLFMWSRALLRSHYVKVLLMSATPEYKIFRGYYRDYLECPPFMELPRDALLPYADADGAIGGPNNNLLGDLKPLWVGHTPMQKTIYFIEDLRRVNNYPKPFDRLITPRFIASRDDIVRRCGIGHINVSLIKEQVRIALNLISLCSNGRCVLIFVAGRAEMEQVRSRLRRTETNEIIDVHGDLDREEERNLVRPVDPNKIRIILATNAAESSVTLPAVDIVIDFGTNNVESYDSNNYSRTLLKTTWISRASSKQRAGRTGRVADGTVYRLYSRKLYRNRFGVDIAADITRKPLHDAMIRVLGNFNGRIPGTAGIGRVFNSLVQVPDMARRQESLNYLFEGKLITDSTEHCSLTRLGEFASIDAVGTQLSRLIFYGIALGVGPQCVILAAALSIKAKPLRGVPAEYRSPDEFNKILRRTYFALKDLDGGAYSESMSMVKLFVKMKATNLHYASLNQLVNDHNLHEAKARQFYATANIFSDRVNKMLASLRAPKLAYDNIRLDKDFIALIRIALLWSSDGSVMRTARPPSVHPDSAKFNSVLFRPPITVEKIQEAFDPEVCPQEDVRIQERYLYVLKLDNNPPSLPRVVESFFTAQPEVIQGLLIWLETSVVLATTEEKLIPACNVVIRSMLKTSGVDETAGALAWSTVEVGGGSLLRCVELPVLSMTSHNDAREFLQVFNSFCEVVCCNRTVGSPVYARTFGVPRDLSTAVVECLQQTRLASPHPDYDQRLKLPTYKLLRFLETPAANGDIQPSPEGMNYLTFITSRDKRRQYLCVDHLDHRLVPSIYNHNVNVPMSTYVTNTRAHWEILDVNGYVTTDLVPTDDSVWQRAHTDTWSALAAMHPTVAGRPRGSNVFAITSYSMTVDRGDFVSVRCEQISLLPYSFDWIQRMMACISPSWVRKLDTAVADPTLICLRDFIEEKLSNAASGAPGSRLAYDIELSRRMLDFHRRLLHVFDNQPLLEEAIPLGGVSSAQTIAKSFIIHKNRIKFLIGKNGRIVNAIKTDYKVAVDTTTNIYYRLPNGERGNLVDDWSICTVSGRDRLTISAAVDHLKWLDSTAESDEPPTGPPSIDDVFQGEPYRRGVAPRGEAERQLPRRTSGRPEEADRIRLNGPRGEYPQAVVQGNEHGRRDIGDNVARGAGDRERPRRRFSIRPNGLNNGYVYLFVFSKRQVGRLIGERGQRINAIRQRNGVDMQVKPDIFVRLPNGDMGPLLDQWSLCVVTGGDEARLTAALEELEFLVNVAGRSYVPPPSAGDIVYEDRPRAGRGPPVHGNRGAGDGGANNGRFVR